MTGFCGSLPNNHPLGRLTCRVWGRACQCASLFHTGGAAYFARLASRLQLAIEWITTLLTPALPTQRHSLPSAKAAPRRSIHSDRPDNGRSTPVSQAYIRERLQAGYDPQYLRQLFDFLIYTISSLEAPARSASTKQVGNS